MVKDWQRLEAIDKSNSHQLQIELNRKVSKGSISLKTYSEPRLSLNQLGIKKNKTLFYNSPQIHSFIASYCIDKTFSFCYVMSKCQLKHKLYMEVHMAKTVHFYKDLI